MHFLDCGEGDVEDFPLSSCETEMTSSKRENATEAARKAD